MLRVNEKSLSLYIYIHWLEINFNGLCFIAGIYKWAQVLLFILGLSLMVSNNGLTVLVPVVGVDGVESCCFASRINGHHSQFVRATSGQATDWVGPDGRHGTAHCKRNESGNVIDRNWQLSKLENL